MLDLDAGFLNQLLLLRENAKQRRLLILFNIKDIFILY
jgi:hypothetical protein